MAIAMLKANVKENMTMYNRFALSYLRLSFAQNMLLIPGFLLIVCATFLSE